jgi:hypothetical protein
MAVQGVVLQQERFGSEAGSCVNGVTAPPCTYLTGWSCRWAVRDGVPANTRRITVRKRQVITGTPTM